LAGVGTNRYAYAGNDPVNKSDANGHSWLSDLFTTKQTQGVDKANDLARKRSESEKAGLKHLEQAYRAADSTMTEDYYESIKAEKQGKIRTYEMFLDGRYDEIETEIVNGTVKYGAFALVFRGATMRGSAPRPSAMVQDNVLNSAISSPKPRNAHLAGTTHPKSGVPFDKNGFPDFSRYAKAQVEIRQTGNRTMDYAAANQKAGFPDTPKGYSWHHHQNRTTMQLVPTGIHGATGHTGGVSLRR
jgi:A nuclease of the HNH/ENDO VII superfamily with conserved WHH